MTCGEGALNNGEGLIGTNSHVAAVALGNVLSGTRWIAAGKDPFGFNRDRLVEPDVGVHRRSPADVFELAVPVRVELGPRSEFLLDGGQGPDAFAVRTDKQCLGDLGHLLV